MNAPEYPAKTVPSHSPDDLHGEFSELLLATHAEAGWAHLVPILDAVNGVKIMSRLVATEYTRALLERYLNGQLPAGAAATVEWLFGEEGHARLRLLVDDLKDSVKHRDTSEMAAQAHKDLISAYRRWQRNSPQADDKRVPWRQAKPGQKPVTRPRVGPDSLNLAGAKI